MSYNKLYGCGTALVTPFTDGEVDWTAYTDLVKRQVRADISFLVPLGSTAETPCLDDDEKVRLLEATIANAPGKLIMAGVGTNSLRATLRNMELLKAADMYLVVVPYYNKPTPRGQYEYFKAVAESTDKPIVLYNVPGRTGTNMSAATTLKLAEIPNIVGIKEASGNMSQIRDIIDGAPHDFAILSGNDDQTLDIIDAGGHGVISVASNLVPGLMVRMVNAARSGDYRVAIPLYRQLLPFFDACFIESNPMPIKAALAARGLIKNELRLPLVPAEPLTYHMMAEMVNTLAKTENNF